MVYALYMRSHAYKNSYVWNPEIAYLTGLIASDGCLVNDNRHINITSKDQEIINSFQSILGMDVKVGTKIGGYSGTSSFNLQFSNVALYDFFLRCGLTPAKSKTMGPLLIPEQYYPDFLRGYFDGDGTIYGFWDRRWRNSLMYYTGYVSGSLAFLQWLQQMNARLAFTSFGAIRPGVRAFTLSYAKADSRKLFQFMYHKLDLPMLSRKYQKFIAFLVADPYPSKELARVLESVDRLA